MGVRRRGGGRRTGERERHKSYCWGSEVEGGGGGFDVTVTTELVK